MTGDGTPMEELGPGLFAARTSVVAVDDGVVRRLKDEARASGTGRARLLLHGDPGAALHEMLIAASKDTYWPPHLNTRGAKSWRIVEGAAACFVFSKTGGVDSCTVLDANAEKGPFMLRLSEPFWHTVLPLSEPAVYVETTGGPFEGNVFADWAPKSADTAEGRAFVDMLRATAQGKE